MNSTEVIKQVLTESPVDNSSGLIVALYHTYKKIGMVSEMLKVDPIYQWENGNWHFGWESNCAYIHKKLEDLDDFDYEEVLNSYEFVLQEFLNSPPMNSMYKLDTKDIIGWGIYKELCEKRESVKKQRIIAEYNRKTHVKI